jgi:hypothetical protein
VTVYDDVPQSTRLEHLKLFAINISVPNVYPVDLFEHVWVVDRLDRLGISRYFQREIKQCMDYVHRFFSSSVIPCFSTINLSFQEMEIQH